MFKNGVMRERHYYILLPAKVTQLHGMRIPVYVIQTLCLI